MQELIKYAQDGPQLIPEKIAGWVLIGRAKAKSDDIVRKDAILLQSFLDTGHPDKAETIKQYKNVYEQMVQSRKDFTSGLDMLKEMCMETEKKYDPKKNEQYLKLEADELQERLQKKVDQQRTANKENEKLSFTMHVQSEYARVVAQYKTDLSNVIFQGYAQCLQAKTPPDQVANFIPTIKKAMTAVTLSPVNPFKFSALTTEDINAIVGSVPKPVYNDILTAAFGFLNEKFSLYTNDLAASANSNVLQQAAIQHQEEVQKVQQEAQNQIATNNLVASAGVYVGNEVKVKEKTSIKIADTDEWTVKICAAFIANYKECVGHLNVKKLSNLNVGQMAKALDAAGVQVLGVEYETIQK